MIFENREDAALKLCDELKGEDLSNTVVVGVLRGGGYMAKILGKCLNIPFGVLPVKKIAPPESPESGFGAVVYDGTYIYDQEYAKILGVDEDDLREIVEIKLLEAKKQYELYKEFIIEDYANKNVILVDDGIATGYTVIAAAKFIRKHNVNKLTLAIPVASDLAYELVKEYFDKIICLEVVRSIYFSVGMFYRDFKQFSDEELLEFLGKN
ncbi:MAG: phosphoribosyltransferase family protein [candidate division WOR-3 bacterium]